jgi:hypothetical protein
MTSADDILREAAEARAKLDDLHASLADQRRQIHLAAARAGRDMTAAEAAEFDRIGAALDKVFDLQDQLRDDTFAALDSSVEVLKIRAGIEGVNADLDNSLKRLAQIEQIAATVAAVADGVAKILASLATVAAALP